MDRLALRGPSVKLDCPDWPGPRAPRESQAVPACTDRPARPVIEDRPAIYRKSSDRWDRLDPPGKVGLRAYQGLMARRANKVTQGNRVPWACPARTGSTASEDQRETADSQVHLAATDCLAGPAPPGRRDRPAPWWKGRRCRAHPGRRGWTGHQVCRAYPALRESVAPAGNRASAVKQVCPGSEVPPASKAKRAAKATEVFPDKTVKKENPACLERVARPESREHLVFPASLASKASLACQAIRDHLDDWGTQDRPDLTARMASMVRLGCPARLEIEASLVRMEPPAFRDCLARQVQKATLDRLASQDTRDRLASRVTLDCLDRRVHVDIEDRQDRRVMEGRPDQLVLRVRRD